MPMIDDCSIMKFFMFLDFEQKFRRSRGGRECCFVFRFAELFDHDPVHDEWPQFVCQPAFES